MIMQTYDTVCRRYDADVPHRYTVFFSIRYHVWFACRSVGGVQGERPDLKSAEALAVKLNGLI